LNWQAISTNKRSLKGPLLPDDQKGERLIGRKCEKRESLTAVFLFYAYARAARNSLILSHDFQFSVPRHFIFMVGYAALHYAVVL